MIFKTKTKQYCWLYHFGRGKDHIVAILGTSTNQKKKDRFFDPKKSQKSQVTKPAEKNHHNLAVEMPTQLTGGSAKISRRMNLAILRLSVWELNEQT